MTLFAFMRTMYIEAYSLKGEEDGGVHTIITNSCSTNQNFGSNILL